MKTEVYTCDICGKQKGEANHWFQSYEGSKFSPVFHPWNGATNDNAVHLCGQECCHKLLDKWFAEVK